MVKSSKLEEPFIKNIPLRHIYRIVVLPENAIKVFLYLWYLSGVTKKTEDLAISYKKAKKFNINERGVSRGLGYLEKAGIIKTNRGVGRAPRVTLLLD
ncbi:hypothetical protein V7O66_06575 [Methanolobus sp. ZRKC3]|uniref:hypothetical protein n=1 Tax=Methanolobus sp. ZRKC3 TaxID=3125786 RepID=UPI003245E0AA